MIEGTLLILILVLGIGLNDIGKAIRSLKDEVHWQFREENWPRKK